MGYTFKIQSVPAGLGGALFDAARNEVDFAQQVEKERLRLAKEASQREATKLAMDAEIVRLQETNRAADNARADRKLQFDSAVSLATLKQGDQRINLQAAGLQLEAQKVGMQGAGVQLDAQREGRIAKDEQERLEQARGQEQLKLIKMGARPIARNTQPVAGDTYVDGRGRTWLLPDKDPAALKNLIPFARHNVEILNTDMDRRLKEREDLEERVAKVREGMQSAVNYVKSGKGDKARLEASRQQVAAGDAQLADLQKQLDAIPTRQEMVANRDAARREYAKLAGVDAFNPYPGQAQAPGAPGAAQAADAAPDFGDPPAEILPVSFLPKGVPQPSLEAVAPEQRAQVAQSWNQAAQVVDHLQSQLESARNANKRAQVELAGAKGEVQKTIAGRKMEDAATLMARVAKQLASAQRDMTDFAERLGKGSK